MLNLCKKRDPHPQIEFETYTLKEVGCSTKTTLNTGYNQSVTGYMSSLRTTN